jgi:hypothetical protein
VEAVESERYPRRLSRPHAPPLRFIESDVSEVTLEPGFDVILRFGVLYHLVRPQDLLRKLTVLEPDLLLKDVGFHVSVHVQDLGEMGKVGGFVASTPQEGQP